MKSKPLLFVCCLGLLSSVFADNRHLPVNANDAEAKAAAQAAVKRVKSPSYCEIEIINYSYNELRAWGRVSNGAILSPFYIPAQDNSSHHIDLYDYHYGYCPEGMDLTISTVNGYIVYSQFTRPDTTVKLVPYLNKARAEILIK